MTDDTCAEWDGKNFARVQLLLTDAREHGEPACRLPGGDMARMEVRTLADGWVAVQPGQRVCLGKTRAVSVESPQQPD
jgi:hypothetical protein